MTRDGFALDLLASVAIGFAILALLANVGALSVGVGMMLAPLEPEHPDAGAGLMILATLACGVPGTIALVFGAARLARRARG